jgi:hypothetical protein
MLVLEFIAVDDDASDYGTLESPKVQTDIHKCPDTGEMQRIGDE